MKLLLLYSGLLFTGMAVFGQSQEIIVNPKKIASNPKINWTFSTNAPIYGSPVIVDQVLFIGSTNGFFYAIDSKSGKQKWKVNTRAEIRSTATIILENIYITNAAGSLYCLNKNDGQIIWIFTRPGEKQYHLYSFADYYQSSPVYEKGVIYMGSGNGNIYAVDALSGLEKWHFSTGDVVHATPVVGYGKLFIGSFDGYFYALDLNGNLLWKFKSVGNRFFPLGEMQGNPVAFGFQVIVGSRDYNLYAIDTGKGYCHWNIAFQKGWAMGQPLIEGGILYAGTSDDKLLLAIDPETGRIIWQTNLQFNIFGGPAITHGMLYIGNLMGKLFAVDQKTGEIIWTFETFAYKLNRFKYFKPDDTYKENLFGTTIQKNEDFLTMYYELGGIFSTPVQILDKLFFTSTDGLVYCLNLL